MNYKMIGRFLSKILAFEAIFMVPALAIALYDYEKNIVLAFLQSMGIILVFSLLLWFLCRNAKKGFYAREGIVCVGCGWITMSILGCLPFYFSGQIPRYIDALFEIVSGFTTTGASILTEVESLSRGILFWRSFSHWLGGMGVLVLLLAFSKGQDRNSGSTLHILRAESTGANVGKLVPRMKQTAVVLYIMYFVLTLLDFVFLLIGDIPWFDAICTAFGTAGTGGFGIKNDSIAGYSPYIQNVCTVFMLLFGVNFAIYFLLLTKQIKGALFDEELRLYVGLVAVSIIAITININGYYDTLGETIRHAAFQVASIITTTGFATTNYDIWPSFSKGILLILMFIGACAGSTGGGMKCQRALLLSKTARRNVRKNMYPNKVQLVTINKNPISEKVISTTQGYLTAYAIIIAVSFLLISLDGFALDTNISAVVACFNNIGPGFNEVGPTCNFSAYSDFSKFILILDMLAGRLEIFPILTLFALSTWKRK